MAALSPKPAPRPRRHAAISRDALVAIGMVVLIAGMVVLSIWSWQAQSENPRDPAVIRAHRPIEFECELCGHKFSLEPREFHKQWKDVDLSKQPPGARYKANCPKCGKPFCSKMLNMPTPPSP